MLFKINHAVNYRFIEISNGNITNTLLFFVEKIRESYGKGFLTFFQQKITVYMAKDSHIFSTKNNSVFAFEVDIVNKLRA